MNGVGRLQKQTIESNEAPPPSSSGMKRLWWRYSSSAQRASPPARIVLVVLLCAQIMFLAIIRLGPVWGGQGSGGSVQASPRVYASLSRNSILLSGISMEGQASSGKESEASSELVSSLPKKHAHRKEKPTSKQKAASKKMSRKEKAHLEMQKTNNVAHPDQRKGSSDAGKVETSLSTKEHFDELLPSVDDKFLTETTIKESFNAQASLAGDGLPSLKKEGKQEEGSSVAGDASYVETSFSSMRKAQANPRVRRKHKRNASKIKQVVAETDVQTEQEEEKTGGKEIVGPEKSIEEKQVEEKVEEATIDKIAEDQATKQEVQPAVAEEVSQNAISMIKVAEEEWGSGDLKKEQEASSAEKVEEAAVDVSTESNPTNLEAQPISAADKTSKNAPFMTKAAKEELSVEESQAASEEKVSKQASVKEEAVVLVEQKGLEKMSSSECSYGYIYVYDLPPAFNHDIISNCTALNPWFDVCPTLSNGGLGESLGKTSPLGQEGSWYASDHFTAEIVFHNRILQHACLTDKMEIASAFYVPFYAGLDVGRYLVSGASVESRDRLSNQFVDWLMEQLAWKKRGGVDHFMMVGRITWDFRRSRDDDWGSGFFNKPALQNMTKLLIERNPWDNKEMGVPYPTNFHPQSDADLVAWQNHVRGLKRNNLFSFAGVPRDRFPNDFRRILFEQCNQAEQCRSLDCSNGTCDDNQKTLEFFMDSTFCLQPRGDSFTRRSTFDCLLAGSIPVFFWHRSAYMQYEWHVPADEGSYSVFISKQDVRNGTKIEDVLKAIAPEKVRSMQEAVAQLMPKVVYAVSGFALKEKDAFDVAIQGVMRRLNGPKVSSQ